MNRLVSRPRPRPRCDSSSFDGGLLQEDSVLLYKAVCANKLLARVDLVLFLNKCDILDAKLRSGIRLAKYLRSFGDRPNDLDSAQKCGYMLVPMGEGSAHGP